MNIGATSLPAFAEGTSEKSTSSQSEQLISDLPVRSRFLCESGDRERSACINEPFYAVFEGKSYCVLHYPNPNKHEDFRRAFKKKLERSDFDFRGIWFSDQVNFQGFEFRDGVCFNGATFNDDANFSEAKFNSDVSFRSVTFSGAANFRSTIFRGEVNFRSAQFNSGAYFSRARFEGDAFFSRARFNLEGSFRSSSFAANAEFSSATFCSAADFGLTTIHKNATFCRAAFQGPAFFGRHNESPKKKRDGRVPSLLSADTELDFQYARVDNPTRFTFQGLELRPHWFLNVDPRDFALVDVKWNWHNSAAKELKTVESKAASDQPSCAACLGRACRQLAENAEKNSRYQEASEFRYWAMELERRSRWQGWKFWKSDWLLVLYWSLSGYSERILRALAMLIIVWALFVPVYHVLGFAEPEHATRAKSFSSAQSSRNFSGYPLSWKDAADYSLEAMMLREPEPRPFTLTGKELLLAEHIIGPVQALLLVLAIRRKLMR